MLSTVLWSWNVDSYFIERVVLEFDKTKGSGKCLRLERMDEMRDLEYYMIRNYVICTGHQIVSG
jgi:hypothetical protein